MSHQRGGIADSGEIVVDAGGQAPTVLTTRLCALFLPDKRLSVGGARQGPRRSWVCGRRKWQEKRQPWTAPPAGVVSNAPIGRSAVCRLINPIDPPPRSLRPSLFPSAGLRGSQHGVRHKGGRHRFAERRARRLPTRERSKEVGGLVDESMLITDLQTGHPPMLHKGVVAIG